MTDEMTDDDTQHEPSRWWKYFRRLVAFGFVAGVVAVVGGWHWLKSDGGQAFLSAKISELASTQEYRIDAKVNEVSIRLVGFEYIRVSDAEGEFLAFDNVTFWYGLRGIPRLLRGEPTLRTLRAMKVRFDRLPVDTEPEERKSYLPKIEIPELPFDGFRIGGIDMREIHVGAALYPDTPVFRLRGDVRLSRRLVDSEIDLMLRDEGGSVDEATTRASLVFKPARTGRDAVISIDVADHAGGFITQLAGVPDEGDLRFSVNGNGVGDDWDGQADLAIGDAIRVTSTLGVTFGARPRVAIEGSGVKHGKDVAFQGALDWSEAGVLGIEKLGVDIPLAHLDMTGSADFATGALDIKGRAGVPEYSRDGMVLKQSAADFHLRGAFDAPVVDADVTVAGFTRGELRVDGMDGRFTARPQGEGFYLEGDGTLDRLRTPQLDLGKTGFGLAAHYREDGTIVFDTLKVDTPQGRLQGKGVFDPQSQTLDGSIDASVPAIEKYIPSIKGAADVALTAKGGLAPLKLSGQATVTARKLDTGSEAVNDMLGAPVLKTGYSLTDSAAAFDGVGLAAKAGRVTGAGRFEFAQNRKRAVVKLSSPRLSTPDGVLRDVTLDADLGGAKNWAGKIAATGKMPDGTAASLDATLDVAEGRVVLTDATARYGGYDVAVPRFAYDTEKNAVTGSLSTRIAQGQTRLDVAAAVKGTVAPLRIGWTLDADGAAGRPLALDAAGVFRAVEKGHAVTVEKLDAVYAEQPVALQKPVEIALRPDGGIVTGDAVFSVAGGQAVLSYEGAASKLAARAELRDLDANLGIYPFIFDGRVGGTATLDGTPDQPRGQARLDVKRIAIPGLESAKDRWADGVLTLALENDRVAAHADLQGPQGIFVKGDLSAPFILKTFEMPQSGKLSGAVSGQLDLRALTLLLALDEHRLGGETTLELNIAGTPTAPVITGTGAIRDGSYSNLFPGTRLADLNADLEADADELRLLNLTATDGRGGKLRGAGRISFADMARPDFDIAAELSDMQLVRQDNAELMASGTAGISGDASGMQVAADLEIDSAEIYVSSVLPTAGARTLDVVEINKAEDGGPVEKKKDEAPRDASYATTLDLHIGADKGVFVRGQGLDSEWSGDVRITGKAEDPAVGGKLSLVRGRYDFFDALLVFEKGAVEFIKGNPPDDPLIDVAAKIRGKTANAQLRVGGSAKDPTFDLSSTPPLPDDEILSRVFFGKAVDQLTPMQVLRIAQVLASLSGNTAAGFDPVSQLRRKAGIDVFTVDTGAEGNTSVEAGKYIGDDVYLSVEHGTAAQQSEVKVEMNVTPNVQVETSVGNSGESSAGIKWKYDY